MKCWRVYLRAWSVEEHSDIVIELFRPRDWDHEAVYEVIPEEIRTNTTTRLFFAEIFTGAEKNLLVQFFQQRYRHVDVYAYIVDFSTIDWAELSRSDEETFPAPTETSREFLYHEMPRWPLSFRVHGRCDLRHALTGPFSANNLRTGPECSGDDDETPPSVVGD